MQISRPCYPIKCCRSGTVLLGIQIDAVRRAFDLSLNSFDSRATRTRDSEKIRKTRSRGSWDKMGVFLVTRMQLGDLRAIHFCILHEISLSKAWRLMGQSVIRKNSPVMR